MCLCESFKSSQVNTCSTPKPHIKQQQLQRSPKPPQLNPIWLAITVGDAGWNIMWGGWSFILCISGKAFISPLLTLLWEKKLVRRCYSCRYALPQGHLTDKINNLAFINISDIQKMSLRGDHGSVLTGGFNIFTQLLIISKQLLKRCLTLLQMICVFPLWPWNVMHLLFIYFLLLRVDAQVGQPSISVAWTLPRLHIIWKLVNCLRSLSSSDRGGAEISF